MTETIVALIPARGGSTRIPRKNLAQLGGRSLLAWTITAAQQAGIFGGVYVSTEDEEIAAEARREGATVIARPAQYAANLAPDIGWVRHAMVDFNRYSSDAFAILRPTSPFRSPETIRAAWEHLQHHGSFAVDSLRAVEPAKQHPYKMWIPCGDFISPFYLHVRTTADGEILAPPHSMPTQAHERVLAQNASLEMAWSRVALYPQRPTISGERVLPWFMPGYEGFDVNTPDDLLFAEFLIERGLAKLPGVING